MNARERFATDSTPALSAITPQLEALTERLGVKSVLVMRSEPDAMVVAATAGEATQHYTVGAAWKEGRRRCQPDPAVLRTRRRH